VKRRGFTLIELMVVIAIIIILAAIAIPNYLKMTERAKRSRLASDYATLATVLETFKTDWGIYPIAATAQDVSASGSLVYIELGGVGTGATTNLSTATNAVGEHGPIQYIKTGTLSSIKNPFIVGNPVMYLSTATGATGWAIYAQITSTVWLYRTDSMSTVSEAAGAPTVP
jgi:prepilin-type N-terminal cleavage/methylation domain-containing protein